MGLSGRIKIADFDRCYTLVVQNTNPFAVQVTIFGAKQFLVAANFGLPAGVTANVMESSYQELLQETVLQPFIIGAETITSSVQQLSQINTVRYRDSNGVIQQFPFKTSSYFSIYQYQADTLEIYPIDILVTGEMQTTFNLLANTSTTIVLYVRKRINMANLLRNHPVTEIGSNLYPFFKNEIIL
jgi:hypothetical protein